MNWKKTLFGNPFKKSKSQDDYGDIEGLINIYGQPGADKIAQKEQEKLANKVFDTREEASEAIRVTDKGVELFSGDHAIAALAPIAPHFLSPLNMTIPSFSISSLFRLTAMNFLTSWGLSKNSNLIFSIFIFKFFKLQKS